MTAMAQVTKKRTYNDKISDSVFVSPDLMPIDPLEKNYLDYISEVEIGSHTAEKIAEDLRFAELNRGEQRKINAQKRGYVIVTVFLCIIVAVCGAMMMLLLYPQAQLSELARSNSEAKDRISVLKQELSDVEENNNSVADMDIIKSQALALGMQEPNANQIVIVPMPKDDKFITMSGYSTDGVSDEKYDEAVRNLAEYYRKGLL